MADLPLAIFLALFLVAGAGWLATGSGFHLLLAFAFAATALATKTEGLPQLLLVLAVVSVLAVRARPRRVAALWASTAAAFATFVPWLVWRAANGIEGRVPLSDALDPGYLADRTGRIGPAAEALAGHLADPTEWLVVVPLALALSVAAAVRARNAAWLGPALVIAAGFVFWIWAYWADGDEIRFVLATSSYRVVDALALTAGLAVPVLAERLLRDVSANATAARPVGSDGRPGKARTS
jgi:hypothetical protein